MRELSGNRRDWEELADLDPMWAIVSSSPRRFGRWDEEAFFATGEREIVAAMDRLKALGRPAQHRRALDFGCGIGRATRALGDRFEDVVGVDISAGMVARARELHADRQGLSFLVNDAPDLTALGDRRFDLVYTRVVLQHVAGREVARRYIEDFVGLLEKGGVAVFQIPTHIPWRYRLLVARRLYLALRALRIPPRVLYERLGLHPIRMQDAPEAQVTDWVSRAGGEVLTVERSRSSSGVEHATFHVAEDAGVDRHHR